MSDSIRLDPREVLLHLQQLGYNNITREQLKDFIHDLKKLIKYDQKYKRDVENLSTNVCDSTYASKSTNLKEREAEILKPCNRSNSLHHMNKSNLPSSSNSFSSSSSLATVSSENSLNDVVEPKLYPGSDRYSKKNKCSKSTENLDQASRPTSSFIRPWRLHPVHNVGQGFIGASSHKSDPVSLYHKYKEIWKQQKVPGESDHSELRWHIREKMLGQNPHPREEHKRACKEVPANTKPDLNIPRVDCKHHRKSSSKYCKNCKYSKPVCETPSMDTAHKRHH